MKTHEIETEHGKLVRRQYHHGWTVHPRVGGLFRAQLHGLGVARSRADGLDFLERLAACPCAATYTFQPTVPIEQQRCDRA